LYFSQTPTDRALRPAEQLLHHDPQQLLLQHLAVAEEVVAAVEEEVEVEAVAVEMTQVHPLPHLPSPSRVTWPTSSPLEHVTTARIPSILWLLKFAVVTPAVAIPSS
jgi:hypothetical protein